MTSYHFDDEYSEEVTLKGTKMLLRCVRPQDKQLLVEGMNHLSETSKYRRFFTVKHTLSPKELSFLTEVDGVNHFAMGAAVFHKGKEYGIGIARFIRMEDPEKAEPAIIIVDEEQGKGLGHLLFLRLVAAAVERGIKRFHCEIQAGNDPIRQLLDEVPTQHQIEHRGPEDIIEFDLPRVSFYAKDYDEPPKVDPYRRIVKAIQAGRLRLKNNIFTNFQRK